jgi:hypothetical protein
LRALPDLPDPDDVARFAAGAETRTVEPDDTGPPPVTAQPWQKLDKTAKPLSGINLRLNAYEHELLKYLADSDQRSIQQTIKRLLIPAAEAAAELVQSENASIKESHRS